MEDCLCTTIRPTSLPRLLPRPLGHFHCRRLCLCGKEEGRWVNLGEESSGEGWGDETGASVDRRARGIEGRVERASDADSDSVQRLKL